MCNLYIYENVNSLEGGAFYIGLQLKEQWVWLLVLLTDLLQNVDEAL